jgi:molecular chaperone GrpE
MTDEIENQQQKDNQQSTEAPLEDVVAELKEKLMLCERERDEYLDGWRRAKAEFLNYKNDEIKRLEEVVKFGNEDIMRDIIIVLDSFDRGIASLETAGQADAAAGMRRIRDQLIQIMERRGLERMEVKIGENFDPSRHEAIGEIYSEAPPGTIAAEIEPGFLLNGKVIRAAKVNLSKDNSQN